MEVIVKRVLAALLVLLMAVSVYAGKKFPRLGRYVNVEVTRVTPKGVQITHDDGVSIITEKGLSARDKKLIAAELEQYRKLKNARSATAGKKRKEQTAELAALMEKLPAMSSYQIEEWVKAKFGVRPDDDELWVKFKKVYEFAENNRECHKLILERMKAAQNEEVNSLIAKLKTVRIDDLLSESKKIFGVDIKSVSFRTALEKKYYMAENCGLFIKEAEKLITQYDKEMERRRIEEERRRREEELRRRRELAESYYREITGSFVQLANNVNRGSDQFLRQLIYLKGRAEYVMNNAQLSSLQHAFLKKLFECGEWAELHYKWLNLASQNSNLGRYYQAEECINDAKKCRNNAASEFNNAVRLYNAL